MRDSGTDLAIVTYGNGFHLSCQAAKSLRENHNVAVRIVDLRWLDPAPNDRLLEAIAPCSNILIVDECRVTGSQSDTLMTLFTQNTSTNVDRYAAEDCFIATGSAYAVGLPSREGIVESALRLLSKLNSKRTN